MKKFYDFYVKSKRYPYEWTYEGRYSDKDDLSITVVLCLKHGYCFRYKTLVFDEGCSRYV